MRRLLTVSLGALALLVIVHTVLWRWAESRLESGFDDWASFQRTRGWTITSVRRTRTGWPAHAALDITGLKVAGGDADIPGGLDWTSPDITLSVSLFHPRSLIVTPEGLESLRVGAAPRIAFAADSLTAEIPLDPGVPARRADVRGIRVRVELPGGEAAGSLTLALLQAQIETQPNATQGEPALSFSGSAQDIGLPPAPAAINGGAWPLGPRIASLSVEGDVTGPVSRAIDPRTRAAAWRDGGGTIDIRRLATGWGPLGLSFSATLALDEQLQPMGAGTAHLIGQNEAIDALMAGHVIKPGAATAAKAVLGLVARTPENGGAPEADMPLSLQNRTLSVMRIPLLKVPELVWP